MSTTTLSALGPSNPLPFFDLPPELRRTIIQALHPPWSAQVVIHKNWGKNNTFPFTLRHLNSLPLLLTCSELHDLTISALHDSFTGVLDLTECSPARFLQHEDSARGLLRIIGNSVRMAKVPENIIPATLTELRGLLPVLGRVEVNVFKPHPSQETLIRLKWIIREFTLEDFVERNPEAIRAVDQGFMTHPDALRLNHLHDYLDGVVLKTWLEFAMKDLFPLKEWIEGDILKIEVESSDGQAAMVGVGFGKTPLREMKDAFLERKRNRVMGERNGVDMSKLQMKDRAEQGSAS